MDGFEIASILHALMKTFLFVFEKRRTVTNERQSNKEIDDLICNLLGVQARVFFQIKKDIYSVTRLPLSEIFFRANNIQQCSFKVVFSFDNVPYSNTSRVQWKTIMNGEEGEEKQICWETCF